MADVGAPSTSWRGNMARLLPLVLAALHLLAAIDDAAAFSASNDGAGRATSRASSPPVVVTDADPEDATITIKPPVALSRRRWLSSTLSAGAGAMVFSQPQPAAAAPPLTADEAELNWQARAERALRPKPAKVLRPRMNLDFAVLLMRSSYNAVDDLDIVAMDQFQRDFFLIRQAEYKPYVDALGIGVQPNPCAEADLGPPEEDDVQFDGAGGMEEDTETEQEQWRESIGEEGGERVIASSVGRPRPEGGSTPHLLDQAVKQPLREKCCEEGPKRRRLDDGGCEKRLHGNVFVIIGLFPEVDPRAGHAHAQIKAAIESLGGIVLRGTGYGNGSRKFPARTTHLLVGDRVDEKMIEDAQERKINQGGQDRAHPLNGDLADPNYFDFISFAQYNAITREITNPETVFEEQQPVDVGEGQPQRFDKVVVRRDASLTSIDLCKRHTEKVGNSILDKLIEKFGDTASAIPKIEAGSRPNAEKMLAAIKQMVNLFTISGFAWEGSASILNNDATNVDAGGTQFAITFTSPATLWSGQSLKAKKAALSNDFALKTASVLAARAGYRVTNASVKYANNQEITTFTLT
ncbi:hypothetical protein ACHAXT_001556 [Thalassiosira profunda]